jgi:hypothetical protein
VPPVDDPLVGLGLSQVASSLTDQLSIPPPEFHILRVCLEGLEPGVVLKLKLDGL